MAIAKDHESVTEHSQELTTAPLPMPTEAAADPVEAQAANAASADDKRKHTRFDVTTQASVNVLGSKNRIFGQIADLSQTGFKLLVPSGFPIGEIIRAEVEDEVFVAVVCYSKKSRDGYTIGTELVHSIKRTHLNELVGEWGVRA